MENDAKHFEVRGKHVAITADTVNAFKLGFEAGFKKAAQEPSLSRDESYIAMVRDNWLVTAGVKRNLLED
jgi:hypothetical protein